MREKKRVEVNQRALVDKVLARYPEDFTVFRELLQNADDAGATEVQIEFQTAKHSAGANGKANGINGTNPNLNNTELFKWVVRNNGICFAERDWDRLTKIADGNPDEQKIGAFGVGFYSVFSITDSPLVLSGGKSLSIFFEGDQLYTLDDTCADSPWTSIEMELKEDSRGPVPKPFDLARFLAATMTFMSSLKTTSVLFDGKVFLKIAKSRQEPSKIPIPNDMKRSSSEGTMNITTVSVVTQRITVEITDWALHAGTNKPSVQHSGVENLPSNPVKRKAFWSSSKKGEIPKVAPPSRSATYDFQAYDFPPLMTHTATYAVYSAEVTVSTSDDLHKGLKAMTKKDPPPHFEFEMVYFSKEEHDARAAEEKRDPMGSVFRGPQGLFPQLDGEYTSRVFIGQSTAQTTGIGGHLSGRFIPTVERGSIDLTNGHIAKWNEELLYVGGFLARLVYEKEIGNIWNTWPKGALTNSPSASSSREKASYAMRCFTFNTSTPDGKVSKILQDAFFGCSYSDSFPIMSNSGIQYTKDVRQPNSDFSPFMKRMPVLLPTSPGDPPSLIDSLPYPYEVRLYSFRDVVNELQGRILQDDEMLGLLRWWVDVYEELEESKRAAVQPELTEAARLNIGNPKREVALSNISKFVDSSMWLPWISSDDPLPPDTIPFSFTRTLDRKKIPSALYWTQMTVVDWLNHLISPQIDAKHNIRENATYSNRVLGILGNIWSSLPSDMKSEAQDLMKDVPWIATNKGLRRASEAYFKEADVFRDLPVVTANLFEAQVEHVLSEFGVKRYLDFDNLFEKAEKSNTWSAVEMIRYLNSDPNTQERLDDFRDHAVFPCDKGRKWRIADLYLPHPDISPLGLPVLHWPQRIDPDDEEMLTGLGFLQHPPLDKIIEIAGSDDVKIRHAAYAYFSKKFDELYDKDYDPSCCVGKPFIPALKDGVECVGTHEEVYSDSSWSMMGFQKVHHSVDRKVINRLRMREAPSAEQVIEVFKERPPQNSETATKWFAFLSTKQVLSPGDLQQIADIPIVPVASTDGSDTVRMVPPRECFLGGSQFPEGHLHRRIFTFVDFGDRANGFLKACGVKTKPDCSDIVSILMKDPYDFLAKTNTDGEQGPDKYLTELRSVAVGYDGLSEEDKRRVWKAPIFVGYRVSASTDANQPATLKDEFQLVKASEVLIADDMENRRIFGNLVWLAPQDELLEKLYESVGSAYLSNHIKYDVKPSKEANKNDWPRCEEVRTDILEKLPIFLHEFDKQRLKNASMYLHWGEESRFLVRGCRDLKVEKRLDSNYCISPELQADNVEFNVSAEITTDENSLVTLWLKKADHVDMYDVAVALCRLLFKTHKKHDVLSLMTILETDKEVLRRRGYDVDRIKEAHKVAVLEDKRREKEREEEERKMRAEQHNGYGGGGTRFRSRFLDLFKLKVRRSKGAGTVKVSEIDNSIAKIFEDIGKGEATPEEQEIRNREHSAASKKAKNVEYCAEKKVTDLDQVDVEGAAGLMRVWKQKNTQIEIPRNELIDFATIIHELSRVFNLSNADNSLFNIFWHPDDRDLMGFNRNRLIFLNLAHYVEKRVPLGMAYIEWYYIIVHEIAHNVTPFHDEHHELLVAAMSSRFLQRLHDVEDVRDYFRCAPDYS